ncbi:MAG: toll/interleukin-1 receptor domain-containing protein [Clostridia bacterium]|nr:toll/interleukin-1 receptor domain-containing protein [Clostridia bacterium]
MGYAFISYSARQRPDADRLRLLLQNNKIDTWMAPYDIPEGTDYSDVVNDVIRDAACVVLLLTKDTQSSVYVDKEIERALHYGKTIAPIQLGQVELNDSFAFYLCNQQIATVPALDESIPKIQALLRHLSYLCNDQLPTGDSSADAARDKRVRRKKAARVFCWGGVVFWLISLFFGYQYVNMTSRVSFDVLYDPAKLPSLADIVGTYGIFFLAVVAALLAFLYGVGLKNPGRKTWHPIRVFPGRLVLPFFSALCGSGFLLFVFLENSVSTIVGILERDSYSTAGYLLPPWLAPAKWVLGAVCLVAAVISAATAILRNHRKGGE